MAAWLPVQIIADRFGRLCGATKFRRGDEPGRGSEPVVDVASDFVEPAGRPSSVFLNSSWLARNSLRASPSLQVSQVIEPTWNAS
jgi:hypothetical protein